MMPFFRKLGWLMQRHNKEDDLAAELRFHLEEEAEQREAAGISKEEARWSARRDLGNLGQVQEQTRAAWSWTWLEQSLQDVRYAAHIIRRNPAFAGLAALSLALSIGANTAIYSFMDALLMRSLPVEDPESLVVLKWHLTGNKSVHDSVVHSESGYFYHDSKTGTTTTIFPYPAFELLRKSNHVLSVLFAYHPAGKLNVMIQDQAEVVSGEYVSGDFFRGLAVVPAAGRLIAGDDDRAGTPAVAVLSYAFARRRFGDADRAAGQPVSINNIPFTAIGVAPPRFSGVDPAATPEVYVPMHADLQLRPERSAAANPAQRYFDEHYYWIEMMGRLQPGVGIVQARQALGAVFERWVASTAASDQERRNMPEFLLSNGAGGLDNLRREYSRPGYILWAMVVLILAIACANIANLLLARATARRREMAVRLSLGAGRWRIIRQLLTENFLLASIGGAAGILFAMWGAHTLILLLGSRSEPFPLRADLNWRVFAAATLLTMITGILCGLAPALQATRVDVIPALKEVRMGEPRSNARARFSLSRILIISQIAISMLLLVAAGLFERTLSNLRALEMGFHCEHILVFTLNARQAGHRDPEIIPFYSDLERRFAAIPGVRAASVANSPLVAGEAWGWPVVPLGKQKPEKAPSGHGSGMAATATRVLAVGAGFFRTMQIPVLAGREFDQRDHLGSPPVAIVNQAWVKVNLDGRNPIGQPIVSYGPDGLKPRQMEIIGVAKNAKYEDLTGEFPAIVYMPYEQNSNVPAAEMTFFLRTESEPLACAHAARDIVRQADPRIPVTDLGTLAAQIDQQMTEQILFAVRRRFLVIACVGLYGTMSYAVARRTGEIGIRMALGAQRGSVVWMVLRDVVILSAIGLMISLPVALGASKLVASLLFDVKPSDPLALAAAIATLLSAAIAAGYVPARKASRIDPMAALRHE